MPQDAWAALADPFVEGAYDSVKGRVRTFVLHTHLLRHLPGPPAAVLDVGGGAAHQSLPLARIGYDVTVLDSSPAMVGVLGTDTRGDTVEDLSDLMRRHQVTPQAWYGVWLFTDWMALPADGTDLAAIADVELRASLRVPYRQLSRAFHLVGRRSGEDDV